MFISSVLVTFFLFFNHQSCLFALRLLPLKLFSLNFWSNLTSHSPDSLCFVSERRQESIMCQVTTGEGWHFRLKLKPQIKFGLDEERNLQGSIASQRCRFFLRSSESHLKKMHTEAHTVQPAGPLFTF